jgi:hypothetical protein
MNTQSHRLVFNPSRGCLIAVAETSRSCGKSSDVDKNLLCQYCKLPHLRVSLSIAKIWIWLSAAFNSICKKTPHSVQHTPTTMHITQIKLSAMRGINNYVREETAIYGSDANYLDMPFARARLINVFAGSNGSGKSTFLDVVRSLSDANLLPTLKRSTLTPNAAYYSYRIERSDKYSINVEFKSNGLVELRLFEPGLGENICVEAYPVILNGLWQGHGARDAQEFMDDCNIQVKYWPSPQTTKLDANFQSELCGLARFFPTVKSMMQEDNELVVTGRVKIVFVDEPGQSQLVPAGDLPAGWKAAAGLLSWLRQVKAGSICVIEEPETHLHPTLQRHVAETMAHIACSNNLQIFLSTHSPVFINSENWSACDVTNDLAVFHVDGRGVMPIDAHKSATVLLDALGASVSDLLQANCVIWVEGPSDRIYIRFWLEAWCKNRGLPKPVENVHYAFSLYGGSVLSHFDAAAPESVGDAISMLRLNRNSFVVMDRDNDFVYSGAAGSIMRTKANGRAKYKIMDAQGPWVWVTDGYTMESHLPKSYFDDGYIKTNRANQVEIGTKLTKTALATKYKRDHIGADLSELFGYSVPSPLSHIQRLYSFIVRTNPGLKN